MNDMFITLMGQPWYHFTLMLVLSIGGGVLWLVWTAERDSRAKIADVCLAGLVGGVVAGRALHVVIWRDYFTVHSGDIPRLTSGGIHAEAALCGALVGAALMAYLRGVHLRSLLDKVALLLPLMSFAAWWGCLTARCAYGDSVLTLTAYPPFLVHEAPDLFGIIEPRFATQPAGMLLSAGLFVLAVILHHLNVLSGKRFWLILLLWSAGMFGLSFLRGDTMPVFVSLRLDGWLHLLLMLLSCACLLWSRRIREVVTAETAL
jgi:prolipoprotein diacylglyceryltransferase